MALVTSAANSGDRLERGFGISPRRSRCHSGPSVGRTDCHDNTTSRCSEEMQISYNVKPKENISAEGYLGRVLRELTLESEHDMRGCFRKF